MPANNLTTTHKIQVYCSAHLVFEVVFHVFLLLWTKLQQSGEGSHQLRGLILTATDELQHNILEISDTQ